MDSRGLLRISDKVYVPENPPTLAALLIRHVHEQPSTGHPGRNRIVHLLSARFHLKNLAQRVAKYLKNCPVCCKMARHTGRPPLLRPLPVPDAPWHDISVDYVRPLPVSDAYNMIMVVVNWLTKMRHYIPWAAKEVDKGTSAPAMPWLFLDHIFRLHGLPETIVSDRGPRFISSFWECLTTSLDNKCKLSTAYHPQTDGQTERANQDLENYLRRYVSWKQDNWARWLSVAEFAANALGCNRRLALPRSISIRTTHGLRYACRKTRHRVPSPKQAPGPYKVEAIHGGSVKLLLPAGSKIHLTVNLSYLRRFDNDPLPGQTTDAKSPDPVIAGEDPTEDEFDVTRILDARINRQYSVSRLQFRVAWRGWPDDPTWYNADDGKFCHEQDALDEFYALPSTVVRSPRSAEVSPPSPSTHKSRDEPFFPGGDGATGRRPSTRSLQTPIPCP